MQNIQLWNGRKINKFFIGKIIMINRIIDNFDLLEYKMYFKDIKEFERMEDRFFAVERYFGDIVGMNVDYVEFCPNNEPPLKNEIIPWLWVIHPEWKKEILNYANTDLREIIDEYEENLK